MQYAGARRGLPLVKDIRRWALAVLDGRCSAAEMTVRIVDEEEAARLNSTYRHKRGATNVLSFASGEKNVPEYLGDLVICAPVVTREAREQHKTPAAHWAHMVVHGTLHLLDYDHRDNAEAAVMERLETHILAGLDYPDPYRTEK